MLTVGVGVVIADVWDVAGWTAIGGVRLTLLGEGVAAVGVEMIGPCAGEATFVFANGSWHRALYPPNLGSSVIIDCMCWMCRIWFYSRR